MYDFVWECSNKSSLVERTKENVAQHLFIRAFNKETNNQKWELLAVTTSNNTTGELLTELLMHTTQGEG